MDSESYKAEVEKEIEEYKERISELEDVKKDLTSKMYKQREILTEENRQMEAMLNEKNKVQKSVSETTEKQTQQNNEQRADDTKVDAHEEKSGIFKYGIEDLKQNYLKIKNRRLAKQINKKQVKELKELKKQYKELDKETDKLGVIVGRDKSGEEQKLEKGFRYAVYFFTGLYIFLAIYLVIQMIATQKFPVALALLGLLATGGLEPYIKTIMTGNEPSKSMEEAQKNLYQHKINVVKFVFVGFTVIVYLFSMWYLP